MIVTLPGGVRGLVGAGGGLVEDGTPLNPTSRLTTIRLGAPLFPGDRGEARDHQDCSDGPRNRGPARILSAGLLEDVLDVLTGLLDVGGGLVRFALGLQFGIVRGLALGVLCLALGLFGRVLHLVVETHDVLRSVMWHLLLMLRASSARRQGGLAYPIDTDTFENRPFQGG